VAPLSPGASSADGSGKFHPEYLAALEAIKAAGPPGPAWEYLEPGLAKAAKEKRPAAIVFTTKGYRGPADFGSEDLREALAKSKAVAIKVLPPEMLPLPANAKPEEVRAEQDAHEKAMARYREAARKYGVAGVDPTLVFVKPDGTVSSPLAAPDAAALKRALEALPGALAGNKAAPR
jgi:hypothetical protein